ncbi:MAG: lysozyme inhibitor LprI family protein [Microvirga sp.]
MSRLILPALAALLSLSFAGPALAASYDCSEAKAPDEKAVCADREMDDQDVEMAVLYTRLKSLLPMGQRGDIETAQTTWLKRRTACEADKACLSKAYADRLFQLRAAFDALAARGPF